MLIRPVVTLVWIIGTDDMFIIMMIRYRLHEN